MKQREQPERAPGQAPAWSVGMRRLVEGVYLHDDALHIDDRGLCEALGVPFRPDVVEAIRKMLPEIIQSVTGRPVQVEVRDYPCLRLAQDK